MIWNKGLTKETDKRVLLISKHNKGKIPPNKMNLDKDKIVELYKNNISIPGISKIFNCSVMPIRRILKENNINLSLKGKLKPRSQVDKMVRRRMEDGSYESPRNGKTFEEIYGEERGEKVREKLIKTKKRQFAEGIIKPWNKDKSHLEDNRILSGENHPLFNNWSSFEPYGKEFNIQLKNLIRKRDNQICMNCGIHREKLIESLTVHHINYDKQCNLPQNLICLCRNCHIITNINRVHWTKFFQSLLKEKYNYQYSETGEIVFNILKKGKA